MHSLSKKKKKKKNSLPTLAFLMASSLLLKLCDPRNAYLSALFWIMLWSLT